MVRRGCLEVRPPVCSHARALLTCHTADLCMPACFPVAQSLLVDGTHAYAPERHSFKPHCSSQVRHRPVNMPHGMDPAVCLKMIFLRVTKNILVLPNCKKRGEGPYFFDSEGPLGPHSAAWVQVYLGAYAVGVLAAGRLALMSMQQGSSRAPLLESQLEACQSQ